MVLCNLNPCSANIIQTNHTPPCSKALCHGVGQYEPGWTKGEKNMLKTRIIHISDMTLTFDLEIWFKVTTYHLYKDTLWVKFETEQAKGREDILQRRDLMDRHTKRRTY